MCRIRTICFRKTIRHASQEYTQRRLILRVGKSLYF